jgi:3D (Asp-Asp-Asp) domain-containing protein
MKKYFFLALLTIYSLTEYCAAANKVDGKLKTPKKAVPKYNLDWTIYYTPIQASFENSYLVGNDDTFYSQTKKQSITVAGLNDGEKYPATFLDCIIQEGCGQTAKNTYISYSGYSDGYTNFNYVDYPMGVADYYLIEMESSATSPKKIPTYSWVQIKSAGSPFNNSIWWKAVDVGHGVKGAHIDLYWGIKNRNTQSWAYPEGVAPGKSSGNGNGLYKYSQ